MDLTLATRDVDGTTVVTVGGEIDVYTAPKLRDKITELVAAGVYDLVIDMEAVEFLDSTGLGVLVGGLKKVRAHDGSLQLVCTQDRLLKIFRITGLAKAPDPLPSLTGPAPSTPTGRRTSAPSAPARRRTDRVTRCGAHHTVLRSQPLPCVDSGSFQ